jgi:hypothetical protein
VCIGKKVVGKNPNGVSAKCAITSGRIHNNILPKLPAQRRKKLTRKTPGPELGLLSRGFEKVADLPDPICVDKREIAQLPYNLKNLAKQRSRNHAVL